MLKAAVIGTGFIGVTHAEAYKKSKKVTLVAIVDNNEKNAKKIANAYSVPYYLDMETMLKNEDIDIIDICLPTFLHEEYVLMSAKHKKHIICEKPFTVTIESAERMVKAVEDASLNMLIGQVIRFWPEYEVIKNMIDEKKLGKIKMINAKRLAQHPNWTAWHVDPKKSGGGLLDLHLHDIDYMCYVFGEVESIYAIGWKSETGCWNHIVTNMVFKDGNCAVVEGSMDMTENYPFTMSLRVNGEKATVDYRLSAGLNLEDMDSAVRQTVYYEKSKAPVILKIDEYDAYQKEIDYFADCIENNQSPKVMTPKGAVDVLRVMKAIERSLETGKIIENI